MRDSQRRALPAINPDTPLTPNERKAIASDAARKALRIKENEEYYKDFFACTLPRMVRILGVLDDASSKLTKKEK